MEVISTVRNAGRIELRRQRTQEGQSESLSDFSDLINIITLIINADGRT